MSFEINLETGRGEENWIYVGGDINNVGMCKVGKTTRNLIDRHRSAQNTGFFIYVAFQIVRGNVHEIEAGLLDYIKRYHGYDALRHFSTSGPSECFEENPDVMASIVEEFIAKYYPSSVQYETALHGHMSRYQCDSDVSHYIQCFHPVLNPISQPPPRSLEMADYRTGNQEIYEVDLGNGHYVDAGSGIQSHRGDDD
ncbi:hypothetical protein QEG11_003782 [Stenotrophomonas maltophilia]|nr:hypothetical protein [Stenotrophomonas maltophilia]